MQVESFVEKTAAVWYNYTKYSVKRIGANEYRNM